MEAVLDLLSRKLRPTIVILEDTHWADEATLDAIKFLGRRMARTNGVLVLTYRDGEVDADHPLRRVIGEIPPQNLVRIQLRPFSEAGIASLIADNSLDAHQVFALTDGNPLFVTEIIASGLDTVPISVQDSVLARASKISPGARSVLDTVSVFPADAEISLIEEILHPTPEELAECVRQGLLRIERDAVAFHHSLTRQAVESALSPSERQEINANVLAALRGSADASRLVHHAREARDGQAIVEFAPLAARNAIAIESHREALAQFQTLEPYLNRLDDLEQASLLDDWAGIAYVLDDPTAVELEDRAIELWRSLDDAQALGRALALGARVKRFYSHNEAATEYALESIAILEPSAPSEDLAIALCTHAVIEWAGDGGNARVSAIASRALEMARETDDVPTLVQALSLKGGVDFDMGDRSGMELMAEGLSLAQSAGYRWEETTAIGAMAAACGDVREVARGVDLARRFRDTAARYDFDIKEAEGHVIYGEFLQWDGRWPEAEIAAGQAIGASPKIAVSGTSRPGWGDRRLHRRSLGCGTLRSNPMRSRSSIRPQASWPSTYG
jgi:hypothetical protein